MNDREFINALIKSYLSNAKNPHQATLDNTFTNRLNDIADKLEKQEKVLKIIIKKNVWVARLKGLIKRYNDLDAFALRIYNINMPSVDYQLTQEEFDLIKMYVEKGGEK